MAPSVGIGVTTMFNQERVNGDEFAAVILKLLIEESRPKLAPTGADVTLPAGGALVLLVLGGALVASRRRHRA